MPTPVNWYDDDRTIIIVTIRRDSIWDEYYQAVEWIVAEVTKVDHRVDIIFHDEVGMPKGNPIPHLKWGSEKIISLPNAGHTLIAGSQGMSNTFVKLIMMTLAKSFMRSAVSTSLDKQLLFMNSLEEALEYIRSDRMTRSDSYT